MKKGIDGNQIIEEATHMTNSKPMSLTNRENELKAKFSMMTSEEIREMMETTENTTDMLICWDYLESLKH